MKPFKLIVCIVLSLFATFASAKPELKALIVDGRNNHKWELTTPYLKQILEETQLFNVDVSTCPPPEEPIGDFRPAFENYDVVIINYCEMPSKTRKKIETWPDATKAAFEQYVENGGGVVIYHAADNAFPEWPAYNKMIGVGGWNGRTEKDGPMIRWKNGEMVLVNEPGRAGNHGKRLPFQVINRDTQHPITQGLPEKWMQADDELYGLLRGPAEHVTLLATAYADPKNRGSGEHEPVLMTIDYGKGRVFHTVLGHAANHPSTQSVGFICTFQRGAEWAATGKVTQPVPADFPTEDQFSIRVPAQKGEKTVLLDNDLSNFETWIGIPHASVTGLPEGTYQSENIKTGGKPLGFNDVKNVFNIEMIDGEPVLHISGEIYGGLTTRKEYENYHFSTQFKWGDKKWEPRLDRLRDSGILYHCTGKHGTFWQVWKSSVEFQVQEQDLGDLYTLAGSTGEARFRLEDDLKVYDPKSPDFAKKGRVAAYPEPDAPHGEWNLLELYTLGTTAVHVVNGQVVLVVENINKKGVPLSKGQIQIQSEGAECFYKQMTITPISDFPPDLKQQLNLRSW